MPHDNALDLTGSVGQGGANHPEDVTKVQQRLLDFGFGMVGSVDGTVGPNTIKGIKLFQSIKNGSQTIGGDGRVDVNGDTHQWLKASNSPRWKELTGEGTGFYNVEVLDEPSDDHNFGTDWLDDTLKDAAVSYQTEHRASANSSLMTINDASPELGGDTPDHAGHETGMCIDLRLPKTGLSEKAPGGRTYQSSDYDRDAMRAQLQALRAQPLIQDDRIFFNDPDLIAEGLCTALAGHDNHVHADINPPARC